MGGANYLKNMFRSGIHAITKKTEKIKMTLIEDWAGQEREVSEERISTWLEKGDVLIGTEFIWGAENTQYVIEKLKEGNIGLLP